MKGGEYGYGKMDSRVGGSWRFGDSVNVCYKISNTNDVMGNKEG